MDRSTGTACSSATSSSTGSPSQPTTTCGRRLQGHLCCTLGLLLIARPTSTAHYRVRTVTRDGTLLAEHLLPVISCFCESATIKWQDGSILAMAEAGNTLFVCSADGHLQPISLDRPAARPRDLSVRVSRCDGLAAVCIIGEQGVTSDDSTLLQVEVLLGDLAHQRVTRRLVQASAIVEEHVDDYDAHTLLEAQVQSSCQLAFSFRGCTAVHTRVLALERGVDFIIEGASSPSWDALGRFLAVCMAGGFSLYSTAGCCLASFQVAFATVPHVHWHPESCELLCKARRDGHYVFWDVLLFSAHLTCDA